MYTLAFETTCDDTSIALFNDNKLILNKTVSSLKKHQKYGGIIPEIAAREHAKNLFFYTKQILSKTKIIIDQIKMIAYANEPGLPGSLHTSKIFCKSLSNLINVKLIPINHVHAHAYSYLINNKPIKESFLSLVVSGGETAIYLCDNKTCHLLNKTKDDAVGEVLDKIGRALKLKYPGGVAIDQTFSTNNANIKIINHFKKEDDFSFSGFKTHVLNLINQKQYAKNEIASSSLKWLVDELVIKLKFYLDKFKLKYISVGGGVSLNRLLRKELKKNFQNVLFTKKEFCGDNAAMIGAYAIYQLQNKNFKKPI